MSVLRLERSSVLRLLRYAINGLLATGVHYALLSVLVGPMGLRPFALANLLAAVIGTVTSFFGNRQFVFKAVGGSVRLQAARFIAIYAALALIHSAYMYVWCDHFEKNYQTGFVLATALQFLLSYIANSLLVFKEAQKIQSHT